jgi:hypothetical protein
MQKGMVMPLSLICACGARIELEDALAGQEIACPECQQPLKAPAGTQNQPIRTSGFALASLILAITGAFTIVGTLAAVVLGLVAVVLILRQRDRLAGLGFAVAGIAIGFVFTGLTLFAYFISSEPFAFAGYVRERNMAPYVDTTGPIEVVDRGWAVTRPTEQWGVARNGQVADELAELFLDKSKPDVLLVQIKQHAFLDVHEETDGGKPLEAFEREYVGEYESRDNSSFANSKGKDEGMMRITNGSTLYTRNLTTMPANSPPGCTGREIEMDVQVAGQRWLMLVRFYHNPMTKSFYVLRAYAPRRFFSQNKSDFEKGLDSFRFVK